MALQETEEYDHLKDLQVVRVKQLQESPGGSCQFGESRGTDGALAECCAREQEVEEAMDC